MLRFFVAFTRWDPLRDLLALQERMERLSGHDAGGWTPPVDIFETAEAFVVTAELPGLLGIDHVGITVPVTFPEAALGGQISVPTPEGGTAREVVAVTAPAIRQLWDGVTGDHRLIGVGVAVPGLVRATDGLVRLAPQEPGRLGDISGLVDDQQRPRVDVIERGRWRQVRSPDFRSVPDRQRPRLPGELPGDVGGGSQRVVGRALEPGKIAGEPI